MSTITDQVRDHLRKTAEGVTAAAIGERIGAAPLIVGKALEELQGLGHARADSLHRWRITEKGRMGVMPEATSQRVAKPPEEGIRATALTLLRQHGDKTPQELADIFPHFSKAQYGSNLSVAKQRGEAHVVGMRNGMNVWRAGPAPKGNGEARAGEIDRAAVARLHDAEEAEPKCEQCGRPRSPQAGRLCRECYTKGAKVNQEVAPAPTEGENFAANCRRFHAQAEEAVSAYIASLQESDPQLKALIAVRDAAAAAVEALGRRA